MATKQHTPTEFPAERSATELDDRTASLIGERLAHALELGRADHGQLIDRLHAIDRYLSFGGPVQSTHDLLDQAYDATPYNNGPELARSKLHEQLNALIDELFEHAANMSEVRTAARLLDPDFNH